MIDIGRLSTAFRILYQEDIKPQRGGEEVRRRSIRTDIGRRLLDGRQLGRLKHKEEETTKLGILRAGNSGIMSEGGDVAGACHRVAHLRQLGLELEVPNDSLLIMFSAGITNEDIVYQDLVHTLAPDEVILRETEIPIRWSTTNGTLVTGRPDMVICKKVPDIDEKSGLLTYSNVPVLGLELKSVASVWTTRTVLIDREPKFAHLTQSAHYMIKLGVPFRLVYKQYAIQAMPDFAHRFFPREGSAGSEHLEYNSDGKPKSVRPFEIVYSLEFREGILMYKHEEEDDTHWKHTVVTEADIIRFYEFVSEMGPRKLLGPVPKTISPDGSDKSYSNCKYCPLHKVCQSVKKLKGEEQYNSWIKEVDKFIINR